MKTRQAYYILDPETDTKQAGDEVFCKVNGWVKTGDNRLHRDLAYRRPIPDAPTPDDGWIPWGGGECPVNFNVGVDVKFKDGEVVPDNMARHWDWCHGNLGGADIIAYRIVKAPEPQWLPLTCDDVPPGSVIRWNETDAVEESLDGWCLIVAVGDGGVTHIQCGNTFSDTSWEELMPHDIKRPGEDWTPCKKLAK